MQRSNSDLHKLYTSERRRQTGENDVCVEFR